MAHTPWEWPSSSPARAAVHAEVCRFWAEQTPMPGPVSFETQEAGPHLVDRLHQALQASGYAQLRRIKVDVQDGCAILQGRVPSYYLKQYAQSLVLAFPGIRRVENEIEVVGPR